MRRLLAPEAARQKMNADIEAGRIQVFRVKQGFEQKFSGMVFRCFEGQGDRVAVEAYEDGRSRHICGPAVPSFYLLAKRGRESHLLTADYGRFLSLAEAWIVPKEEAQACS